MASEGKCQACGQLGVILPSIAAGDACEECGGKLEPTGRPQAANTRWDRSRFADPGDQAAAAKHRRWLEGHKAANKKGWSSGRFEEVTLTEAMQA